MNKIIVIILLIIIYILFETLNLCNIDSFDNVNEYILPKVIYGFWDNLEENIVIQSHIRSWKKYLSSEWEIIILNKDKYTISEFNKKQLIEYLINIRNADYTIKNNILETPFMIAVKKLHFTIIKYFIEFNSSLSC